MFPEIELFYSPNDVLFIVKIFVIQVFDKFSFYKTLFIEPSFVFQYF